MITGSLTGTGSPDLSNWENVTGGKEVFRLSLNGECKEIFFFKK